MLLRPIFISVILSLYAVGSLAQQYSTDSMLLSISSKPNFTVKNYSDLTIEVRYTAKKKPVMVADKYSFGYRSTFGNCYCELYKYDSLLGGYQSVTLAWLQSSHPPNDFKNEIEILTYDPEKTGLTAGKERKLQFNLLDFTHLIPKGKYSMRLFIRGGNKYGYDKSGRIVTNSLFYFESVIMNFEVLEDIKTPHLLK